MHWRVRDRRTGRVAAPGVPGVEPAGGMGILREMTKTPLRRKLFHCVVAFLIVATIVEFACLFAGRYLEKSGVFYKAAEVDSYERYLAERDSILPGSDNKQRRH